jgi:hypothetical protein
MKKYTKTIKVFNVLIPLFSGFALGSVFQNNYKECLIFICLSLISMHLKSLTIENSK